MTHMAGSAFAATVRTIGATRAASSQRRVHRREEVITRWYMVSYGRGLSGSSPKRSKCEAQHSRYEYCTACHPEAGAARRGPHDGVFQKLVWSLDEVIALP